MRNLTSRPRFTKYDPIGGIAHVAKNVFNGSWTLQHAARGISITRECVRQDLIVLIGAAEYRKRVKARKNRVKQSRAPRTLSTAQAVQFLSRTQEANLGPAPRLLKHILERSRSVGVRLALRVCPGKRPVLLTPGGRTIAVRTAAPNGGTRENALGLHRFNTFSAQTKINPIAVFILTTPAKTFSYVFRTKDIAHLNSLVLRYQDLHRKSKYSPALNNWKAIAGS